MRYRGKPGLTLIIVRLRRSPTAAIVPDAVVVGGTASALYAGHNVAEICASLSDHLTHEFVAQMKADTSPDADGALTSLQDWREARERGENPIIPPLPGLKT